MPGQAGGGVWIAVIALWLCAALALTPPMAALWTAAPRWPEALALGVFIAVLNLFWFFGVYYLVIAVVSFRQAVARVSEANGSMEGGTAWDLDFVRSSNALAGIAGTGTEPSSDERPRVLLLYPTRNDFRREAVEALWRVRVRGRCEVVICDDSTLERYRVEIDGVAAGAMAEQEDGLNRVRVVRRAVGSAGWKAGNVNHALREAGAQAEYFAICDADGVFPSDFVDKLLPHFAAAPGAGEAPVAFAQARQEGNPAQADAFGQAMGAAVGAHFRHVVRGRQAGGFVMFYGHGALLSMEAWRAVGGFPENVTEDLAFSMNLRAAGWRGVYADEVVCLEDFPATWPRLRRRSEKWIRGTAECLRRHLGPFLRSPRVPWWEKLDVLMHGATHAMAVPMLLFLLALATVLPWEMKEFRMPGGVFLPPAGGGMNLVEQAMGLRYHVYWSWDFYLVMLLTMLGPSLPLVAESIVARCRRQGKGSADGERWRTPQLGGLRLLHYLAASAFVYLAGLVAEAWAVAAYALTGKAYFRTTNDAADPAHGKGGVRAGWNGWSVNHPLVFALEGLAGAGFLWAVLAHRNLWFLGPGAALLLSPFVAGLGWKHPAMRALSWVPFLAAAALLGAIGWQLARGR